MVRKPPNGRPVVGAIGLGIMGEPMARNLLRAGFPLAARSCSRDSASR
jgi:3-hydroxyisobutyrate dehydrogenase-like beta-hydroxyacid dehydrogenase